MDKMLLLLLVAGLAVGVVLVGGAMMNSRSISGNIKGQNARQTPDSAESQAETELNQQEPKATYEQGEDVASSSNIKTLDFKVDVTSDGEKHNTRFRVRQPGSDNEDVRIDSTRGDGAEMTIILKGSTDEGWVKDYSSTEWTYFTGIAFTQMWQTRGNQYLAYRVKEWKAMEGEEFTVEDEKGKGRVYDIRVNKSLPDSVYSPD